VDVILGVTVVVLVVEVPDVDAPQALAILNKFLYIIVIEEI
jgi:hypothetical protein